MASSLLRNSWADRPVAQMVLQELDAQMVRPPEDLQTVRRPGVTPVSMMVDVRHTLPAMKPATSVRPVMDAGPVDLVDLLAANSRIVPRERAVVLLRRTRFCKDSTPIKMGS